jgi:hypothetical protein
MNDLTKALLKDLEEDLNSIKFLESNMEAVWRLDKLKNNISLAQRIIRKSIN